MKSIKMLHRHRISCAYKQADAHLKFKMFLHANVDLCFKFDKHSKLE